MPPGLTGLRPEENSMAQTLIKFISGLESSYLNKEANNFAVDFKVILGFESTRSDSYASKIWLNDPHDL